jgi:sulfite exporter TauE/SafE
MPIDLLVLGGALLAGLFGGVHCLAMCGGIAVGFSAPRGAGALRHALLLNGGRIGGYVLAGALVGGFGAALLGVARLPGLALAMRMLVGAVLLLAAWRLLAPQRAAWLGKPAAWFWRRLQPLRDRGLSRAGAAKPFVIGLFWGWLPCGCHHAAGGGLAAGQRAAGRAADAGLRARHRCRCCCRCRGAARAWPATWRARRCDTAPLR